MKNPKTFLGLPAGHFSRRQALLGLGALGAAAALPAHAQNRVTKITVAYPPGGVADNVARLLAQHLPNVLGQTVVVDNKAGASGTIAMDQLAKAAADGTALGFAAISPLVLSPHQGKLPYDALKDIAPVVNVFASPVLLLGTSALQARSFKALLEQTRQQPGSVRWATSGVASLGHLMLAHIAQDTGLDFTHVPYKGGGQQVADALSGQFEVLSTNAGPAVLAQIQAGQLHPLAVGSPKRLPQLPHTPTLAELGHPAANLASVFGLFAPAATPSDVVQKLNAAVNQVLKQPAVAGKIETAGNLVTGGSSASFARLIEQEYRANQRIIEQSGMKKSS